MKDIDESAIEIPEDLDPKLFTLDGAFLNNTEEKTSLMCLALEYMYLGRTSFSYIDENSENPEKNKKYLMVGDLFYSLGASTASKTKSLPFFELFSKQCIDSSNVLTAFHEHSKNIPKQSTLNQRPQSSQSFFQKPTNTRKCLPFPSRNST